MSCHLPAGSCVLAAQPAEIWYMPNPFVFLIHFCNGCILLASEAAQATIATDQQLIGYFKQLPLIQLAACVAVFRPPGRPTATVRRARWAWTTRSSTHLWTPSLIHATFTKRPSPARPARHPAPFDTATRVCSSHRDSS